MSYDLSFYKKKGNTLSEIDIRNYLNDKLLPIEPSENQWFFENEDTGVYFSFEYFNVSEDDGDPDEETQSFEGFEDTGYSFNVNYLRPDFFGQEAFEFADKFISDLNLYALDTQSDINADMPIQMPKGKTYENWSKINSMHIRHFSKEQDFDYVPANKLNYVFNYNRDRNKIQDKIGDDYFAPKIMLLKTAAENKIITVSTWIKCIPNVFPKSDYYLLQREKKKFFRKKIEMGFISADTFNKHFGLFLNNYDYHESKIIHPDNAVKAESVFQSINFEYEMEGFAERAQLELLTDTQIES